MLQELKTRPSRRSEANEKCTKKSPLHRLFFTRSSQEDRPQSLGGVYYTSKGLDEDANKKKLTKKHEGSVKSLNTVDTHNSHDAELPSSHHDHAALRDGDGATSRTWTSSGARDHHKGAPILARTFSRRRINPAKKTKNTKMEDQQLLGRILTKSREGPMPHEVFTSNHVSVNNERIKRTVAPVKRVPVMDELARKHARRMAEASELQHSNPAELQEVLLSDRQCGRRIGENVSRGSSLKEMHTMMMGTRSDMNNILDTRFTCMGMGTAKASDGTLYLCQIFQE